MSDTNFRRKRLRNLIGSILAGVCSTAAVGQVSANVIFTEYVEGGSNNKAIEFTNFGGDTIDLSRVSIGIATNGKALNAVNPVTLSGSLAAGASYVIANSSAVADLKDKADTTGSAAGFNGDDGLILYVDGSIVDTFGQVGTDPGSNWGSGDTSTKDKTLRRKASITTGDTVHDDAFNPSVEWVGFPKDTFDGIGCSGEASCVPAGNSAPEISGTPSTTASVDTAYSFTPDSSDADSDALTFSIQNKPSWASFDTSDGALTGTPQAGDVGEFSNIIISVNDGTNADVALTAFAITVSADAPAPVTPTLLFSEYIEGSSNNKAVEITNVSDQAIDLSRVRIVLADNGKSLDTAGLRDFTTTGTLAAGASFVVGNSSANADFKAKFDAEDDITFFNGDDALALYLDGTIVDSFGQAGTDPGSSWGSGDTSTKDKTLRRKVSVTSGDTTPSDAFDPSVQWTGFAQNTLDGLGCSGEAACAVPNRAPTITGTPDTSVQESTAYNFVPTANDLDNDSLTFSIASKPSWASFDTSSGALTGTPANSDVGNYADIVITVNDGTTTTDLAAFSINVTATPVNHAPQITGTPDTSVTAGNAYSFTPSATDTENDNLTFSIQNKPSWASFDTSNGALTGTPAESDVNSYSNIIISVTDSVNPVVDLAAFDIAVQTANVPRLIFTEYVEGGSNNKAIEFTNFDSEAIDLSRVSIAIASNGAELNSLNPSTLSGSLAAGASYVIANGSASTELKDKADTTGGVAGFNGDDGLVLYIDGNIVDTFGQIGTDPGSNWGSGDTSTKDKTLRRKASITNGDTVHDDAFDPSVEWVGFAKDTFDGVGCSGEAACAVPNRAPTITGTPDTSVQESTAYNFVPTANDLDNDSLTFSIASKPSWASFDTSSGALTGTPANSDVGNYADIVITVNDGTTTTDLAAFSINVTATPVNHAPQITGTPDTSVTAGNAYSFTPSATDTENDNLTFSIQNKPSWASFDTSNGALTGTPAESDVNSYSNIIISVTDSVNPVVDLAAFDIAVQSGDIPKVIFSEYVEGSGNNKALEISNLGAQAIELSRVRVVLADNGKVLGTSGLREITLSGSLAANSTYVIGNASADADFTARSDVESTITFFNGDDALVLFVDNQIVDSFGQVGVDPGSNWGSGEYATKERTLRRKASIQTGDSVHDDAFDPSVEWVSFAQNTYDGLGCTGESACPEVNVAPVISGSPALQINAVQAYSFTPSVTDKNTGDSHTFSITNTPSWAQFNTTTGELSGTPAQSDVGSFADITISVSDGELSDTLSAFTITVNPVGTNAAPSISGTPVTTVQATRAYSFTPASSDPENDSLTFAIQNKPSWAGFSNSTGALTGTPSASDEGAYSNIIISVTDGNNPDQSLAAFTITVSAAPAGGDFDYNTYYASAIGKTGDALEAELSLIARQGHQRMSYSDVWDALKYTDEDPNNTSNVTLFYSGRSQSKSTNGGGTTDWNREHSWPKSHGFPSSGQYGYTDIHHLRPTNVRVNSSRGSKDYDEGGSEVSGAPGNYTDSDSFEPRDFVKGDAARMMFYMSVRYDGTDGGMPDLELLNRGSASSSPTLGVLCTLMDWHREDPVDTIESTRHSRIVERQGNRNPFVDNANFAEILYGAECPTAGNVAPVISGSPLTQIGFDTAYNFTPNATDANNDSLTFSITNKPSWASFSTTTGALTGTPAQSDIGNFTNIQISVSDSLLSASLNAFNIEVLDPANINYPPTISGSPASSVVIDEAYSFTPTANDADNDALTFSITNLPTWAAFDTSTGVLSGTPTTADIGLHSDVQISVTDGNHSAVNLDTFAIRVNSDQPTTNVIFTEYLEGSSNNKALEITNFTGATLDLSRVRIVLADNGKALSTAGLREQSLSGSLENGASYVIVNSSADADIQSSADTTSTITFFNGNDTLVLFVDDQIVDVFGQIGNDPGSSWGSGATATKENTLRRNNNIVEGDANGDDAFDPSAQWTGFAQNTSDGLGCSGLGACSGDGGGNGGGNNGGGNTAELGACADPATLISAIQGSTSSSPLTGDTVVVEGIVVGDFQSADQLSGFFIQEETTDSDNNDTTSEGVFVYHTGDAVNVGEKVRLLATVAEYQSMTQLGDVTALTSCGTDQIAAVTAAQVTMPLASDNALEAVEGMLVTVPQSLHVTMEYNFARYGQVSVSSKRMMQPTEVYAATDPQREALATANGRDLLLVDDGVTGQNPETISFFPNFSASNSLRSGATIQNLTGVMNFVSSKFMLTPTAAVNFVDSNPRTAAPIARQNADNIRVASFNVLNYFTRYNGRGADNSTEFDRQKAKIVNAIVATDADIVGLMEIENNGYANDSAIYDLVEGLNAADNTHTWAFVDPGVAKIGTDEIAVGLIYRSDRVAAEGQAAIITSAPFDANTKKHRPPLVQTFSSLQGGDALTILVNHFKSKGSACGGQYDDSIQGNCNGQRVLASQALLAELAKGNPTGHSTTNYMVLGDLNAYSKEDPLQAFYSANYANVANEKETGEHYSYYFNSQAGSLDHMLVKQDFMDSVVQASHWHINSDESRSLDYNTEYKTAAQISNWYADDPYRSSDHDPIIADLDLLGGATGGNRRPVINGTPATSAAVGDNYSFTPNASDSDNDSLTFSITNKPVWMSFDTSTGALTGTAVTANIGSYTGIQISVTDGTDSAQLDPFTLQIFPEGNAAPTIEGAPILLINQDEVYSFIPTANDADSDSLTFSIVNKPSWASFDAATGELSGTPGNTDAGAYADITISVTDSKSVPVSLAPFVITVRAVASGTGYPVIFTEYVEGSSNNKAVEISNVGTEAFDLSRVTIVLADNGKPLDDSGIRRETLSGSLAAGESFVIVNSSANSDIKARANIESTITFFNGDDALVMLVDGAVNDSMGRVGQKFVWGSGSTAMRDNTLRRQASIVAGDRIVDDSYDPAEQWVGFSKDTFDGLGCSGVDACTPGGGTGGNGSTVEIGQCFDSNATAIHTIQGDGEASTMVGQDVIVEGVVVADYQGSNELAGFFLQEEDSDADNVDATSEGIFVAYADTDFSVGDQIRVTAKVAESFDLTVLSNIGDTAVCAQNSLNLVTPTAVNLPLASDLALESLEGMWVNLPQQLRVTLSHNFTKYGEIYLSNGLRVQPTNRYPANDPRRAALADENARNVLLVDDGSSQSNPESISYYPDFGETKPLRSGAKVTGFNGVMYYSFSTFKLVPTELPIFENANPRRSKPFDRKVAEDIRIASFNVLNYFLDFNGRGASNEREFNRQRKKIVRAILATDADVVGLMEIENSGFGSDSAIQNLIEGLNERDDVNNWAFVNPNLSQVGSDSIMVGIIYRANRVAPRGLPVVITDAPFDEQTRSHRPPVIQSFEPISGGKAITVVVNHFRSKGGSCGSDMDDDIQGACNGQRLLASKTLITRLANRDVAGIQQAELRDFILNTTADETYAILGDFNAYAYEDPMLEFYNNGYTNLSEAKEEGDTYSYYYSGVAGSLDHMLTNTDAVDNVSQIMHWHINSDEAGALDYNTEDKSEGQQSKWYGENPYRSSDHDPVIADFNLGGAPAQNQAPNAVDDVATTEEDTAITVDALANDTDADSNTLTLTQIASVTSGEATVAVENNQLVITPAQDYFGEIVVSYEITDGEATATANVTVTVTAINDSPVAVNDTMTMREGSSIQLLPLVNDTDVDGDTLSLHAVSTTHGEAAISSNGLKIDFAPEKNFNGEVTLSYEITDGQGGFATGSFIVTVTAVNDSPIAANDVAATAEDTALTITVLSNDSDIDGDTLTVTSASAQNGSVSVNADNTLSYLPAANFFGTDTLSYQIADAAQATATAQVIVTVSAVNDAPAAMADQAQAQEDVVSLIQVLTNDSDIDGDTLTVTSATASRGAVAVVANQLQYTPEANWSGTTQLQYTITDGALTAASTVVVNVANVNDAPEAVADQATTQEDTVSLIDVLTNDSDIDGDTLQISAASATNGQVQIVGSQLQYTPVADWSGTTELQYTITDGTLTAASTVALTVNNVNDAPVATADSAQTEEDTALTVDVLANDSDIDNETLQLTAATATNGQVIIANNQLQYTPVANWNGTTQVTYTVSDGELNATGNLSIAVSSVNDVPVANADQATTNEDTAAMIDVLANDSDIDGDTLQISAATASEGQVSVVSNQLQYTPVADWSGTSVIQYTITDGTLTANASATMVVTSVNDAPVANADQAQTNEDTAVTIDVLANDSDIDGDSLTITNATASKGDVIVTSDNRLRFTPAADATDAVVVSYTISDGTDTAQAQVNITINAQNDAPIANNDSASTQEETAVFIPALANDRDVDGDSLSITEATLVSGEGEVSISATQQVVYTPADNFTGTARVDYQVKDSGNATASASITINVINVNDAPVAVNDIATTAEGSAITVNVLSNDSDIDGDALRISAAQLTAGEGDVAFTDNAITYTPTAQFNGEATISYTASDATGATDTATLTINVSATNDAPVATDDTANTTEDNAVTIQALTNDSDADGDTLRIASATLTSGEGTVSTTDNSVTYTPTANFNGTAAISYRVEDTAGASATANITVSISAVNDAPSAVNDTATASIRTTTRIDVLTNDSDVDGDALSITSASASVGSVSIDGDALVYEASLPSPETASITYEISDGALTSVAVVSLTINNENAEPVATDDSFELAETATTATIDVLVNDTDADNDTLSLVAVSADAGNAIIVNNQIEFTTNDSFFGNASVRYAVSDGFGGRDEAVLEITQTRTQAPTVTVPADLTVNATGQFTEVALGVATATDATGASLAVNLIGDNFFEPGLQRVYWEACDSANLCTREVQLVRVRPMVNLAPNQIILEGNQANVAVLLSGEHFEYPVTIAYQVTGTAGADDIDLASGQLIIEQGTEGHIQFTTNADGIADAGETVIIDLDPSQGDTLNLGSRTTHTITIEEANLAPEVTLAVAQANEMRTTVAQDGGEVIITANIADQNPDDTHSIQWIADSNLTNLSTVDSEFRVNPQDLTTGLYEVSIQVTDSGDLIDTSSAYFKVIASAPTLDPNADTDGDLINDAEEGFGDEDNDGIPNYLDPADAQCNVLPGDASEWGANLIEVEPGVCMTLGSAGLGSSGNGAMLTQDDIANNPNLGQDGTSNNVGGVFDFVVQVPGGADSVQIVLPQQAAIPAGAEYRKHIPTQGWVTLVTSNGNAVHSMIGQQGFCPSVSDTGWQEGLVEGAWCVRLTLVDGGEYDADGVKNGTIVDPGGVGVEINNNQAPSLNDDAVEVMQNDSVTIDVLANDSDADGDNLNVVNATAEFGQVSINTDSTLLYQTAADFVGSDEVQYTVSDGNGATANAIVTVTVKAEEPPVNQAPVAMADTAEGFNDETITIDVLANDSDPEGDSLTIVSAATDSGEVIVSDNKLAFTPAAGSEGTVTISYIVADSLAAQSTGEVTITVKARPSTPAPDPQPAKSSSGSMQGLFILLLAIPAAFRRRTLNRNVQGK